MRIAILSDIHGNLEALVTALEIVDEHSADIIVCLGDIVGYGANPNECIDLVRKRCSAVVLGNHDAAALDLGVADSFNATARVSAVWTSKVLTDENREFLKSLPMTYSAEGAFFVHSSPVDPEEWNYVLSAYDAREAFRHFREEICFIGHSHIPGVFAEKSGTQQVRRGERFLVNVGSVGQPRDGDGNLSLGIFDSVLWSYENIRAPYEVETTADKIRKAGLPPVLAERLKKGM